jgi:predicted nuclease of restriction endonuclease-like (RecB) superfamily
MELTKTLENQFSEIVELIRNSRTALLSIVNEGTRIFYYLLSQRERLGKRDLERNIDSGYFERTMLSNPKLSPAVRVLLRDSTEVFKDTYIWEFLHLPEPYSEKDLRKALLSNLKKFILELRLLPITKPS